MSQINDPAVSGACEPLVKKSRLEDSDCGSQFSQPTISQRTYGISQSTEVVDEVVEELYVYEYDYDYDSVSEQHQSSSSEDEGSSIHLILQSLMNAPPLSSLDQRTGSAAKALIGSSAIVDKIVSKPRLVEELESLLTEIVAHAQEWFQSNATKKRISERTLMHNSRAVATVVVREIIQEKRLLPEHFPPLESVEHESSIYSDSSSSSATDSGDSSEFSAPSCIPSEEELPIVDQDSPSASEDEPFIEPVVQKRKGKQKQIQSKLKTTSTRPKVNVKKRKNKLSEEFQTIIKARTKIANTPAKYETKCYWTWYEELQLKQVDAEANGKQLIARLHPINVQSNFIVRTSVGSKNEEHAFVNEELFKWIHSAPCNPDPDWLPDLNILNIDDEENESYQLKQFPECESYNAIAEVVRTCDMNFDSVYDTKDIEESTNEVDTNEVETNEESTITEVEPTENTQIVNHTCAVCNLTIDVNPIQCNGMCEQMFHSKCLQEVADLEFYFCKQCESDFM
ncbi:hypothetical protein GEMRC1_011301 [Eukaryota sp. GEM-RC1]